MMWNLFGLLWVSAQSVYDLFSVWQAHFGTYRNIIFWRAMPQCVIWSIWREQNARCFEGWFIHEIKSLLLHSLLDWSIAFYSLPCSSLLDLIEFRNLSG